METERPKFLPSFLDLLRQEAQRSGWWAILPYAVIASAVIGGATVAFIPASFWETKNLAVSTVVFTGLLTLNGLILALGWNAFGRVYDTLFRGEFGAYLAEKHLLNDYLVHISVMHWAQVIAVLASGSALIFLLVPNTPEWAWRAFFALTIATTIYAIKQAVDAVHAMNDLVWQAGAFENLRRRASTNTPPLSSVQGGKN